jgi:membrane protease YdiL (CAAX protease family)
MKHSKPGTIATANDHQATADAVLCSVCLIAFSYLAVYSFPIKAAAFVISRHVSRGSYRISWKDIFSARMLVYCSIGLLMGIAGAMYYRGSFGMPVFPAITRNFVWVAVCIGVMEELVFRGFIQGQVSKLHPGLAIVFAAFAHTTYKVFLFLSPAAQQHHSVFLFFTWTFGAFLLIGWLKYFSKSIIPAILVHAVFDLLVYAENSAAPWWVW